MTFRVCSAHFVAVVIFGVIAACQPTRGAEFGAVLNGTWSDPATWTPTGGPPGAADTAYLGLGLPMPASATASVLLDVDPVVSSVQLGDATLNLNGKTLTSAALGLSDLTSVITKAGGNLQLGAVALYGGSNLSIDVADNLTGNITVVGAGSKLDINKSFSEFGATVLINGSGALNANDAFANTDGLVVVDSGGALNAGGNVLTGSVALNGGFINLDGHGLTCNGLALDGNIAAVNKAGGSVHVGSLNLYNGADFVINPADNLIRGMYVNGFGSHLDINRALNLDNDITVSGAGVIDAHNDVTTNTAGVYLGSTLHMHGHTFTANSLILESSGTVSREGGTVQLGSIRVYNMGHFAINAADSLTGSVDVEDPGSSLLINKSVTLAGPVFVFNGSQLTTTAAMEIGGLWGLQVYNATVDAGGNVDASTATNGVGIAQNSTLKLNGHTLTAQQFVLGYSPYIGGDFPATLDRGMGGTLHLDSVSVRNGSVLAIESGDTVASSILVANMGSGLTLQRNLTLSGSVQVTDHGLLALNGHDLSTDGAMSIQTATLVRTGGGNIDVDSLTVATSASVELRVGDSVRSALEIADQSKVAVVQAAGQATGLSLNAGFTSLSIDGTSQLSLEFGPMSTVDDWILRWAGDHVAEISNLHAAGRIAWNLASETQVTVRKLGDGYTYVVHLPRAAGDYNGDGIVNAADYTVWRNHLGSTMTPAADGNRNGVVDQHDYEIWKLTYGEATPGMGGAAAVPEPRMGSMLAVLIVGVAGSRRRTIRSVAGRV